MWLSNVQFQHFKVMLRDVWKTRWKYHTNRFKGWENQLHLVFGPRNVENWFVKFDPKSNIFLIFGANMKDRWNHQMDLREFLGTLVLGDSTPWTNSRASFMGVEGTRNWAPHIWSHEKFESPTHQVQVPSSLWGGSKQFLSHHLPWRFSWG